MNVNSWLFAAILAASAICADVNNASAQLHQQYTRDTIHQHFDRLTKAGEPLTYPRLVPTVHSKVGEIGELRTTLEHHYSLDLRVLQQIDEGTLVEALHDWPAYTTFSPAGNAHFIKGRQYKTGPYLIKSPLAADIPDGSPFEPHGLWQITGLFKYTATAGNVKTVLVIEPLPRDEIDLPEIAEAESNSPYRKWNIDGVEHLGIYKGFEKGSVIVTDPHRQELRLPLAELPKDQQDWVRKRYLSDRRKR